MSRMKAGDRVHFVNALEFACPFCTQIVRVSTGENGGRAGVMHVMPSCETFDRMEPGEFVHAARVAIEKKGLS